MYTKASKWKYGKWSLWKTQHVCKHHMSFYVFHTRPYYPADRNLPLLIKILTSGGLFQQKVSYSDYAWTRDLSTSTTKCATKPIVMWKCLVWNYCHFLKYIQIIGLKLLGVPQKIVIISWRYFIMFWSTDNLTAEAQ